jgi:hypothetical protein
MVLSRPGSARRHWYSPAIWLSIKIPWRSHPLRFAHPHRCSLLCWLSALLAALSYNGTLTAHGSLLIIGTVARSALLALLRSHGCAHALLEHSSHYGSLPINGTLTIKGSLLGNGALPRFGSDLPPRHSLGSRLRSLSTMLLRVHMARSFDLAHSIHLAPL